MFLEAFNRCTHKKINRSLPITVCKSNDCVLSCAFLFTIRYIFNARVRHYFVAFNKMIRTIHTHTPTPDHSHYLTHTASKL